MFGRGRESGDRVGEILVLMGAAKPDDVERAVAMQGGGDRRRLGELLVALGVATPEPIETALMRQRARRGGLTQGEGVRIIDEARGCVQRAAAGLEELAIAAAEFGARGRK